MPSWADLDERLGGRHPDTVWTLFQVTWAASVLFHLAGNAALAPWWSRALLGGAAVIAIAVPRQPLAAAPLGAAVLVSVWFEAPTLANHWLLQGFVAALVLGCLVVSRGRADLAVTRLVTPARLTLLAFYGFAAFAKLNEDFFEPAVSCAVFYLRESAGSWGAGDLLDGFGPANDASVAVVVALVELSVPVLLAVRRTRHVGVVVGLVFHFLLAVDRDHQFADFSSVLVVLFLLFLDRAVIDRLVGRLRRVLAWAGGRVAPELLRAGLLLLLVAVVVFAAGPRSWKAPASLQEAAVFAWLVYGSALTVAVIGTVRGQWSAMDRTAFPGSRWLLVVPAVALLNGLTPYLEIKSGTSWNMYSNLAVVDGDSNHLVVRRGLPLTGGHERLVRVTGSSDGSLDFYVDSPWLLPERQLLDHIAGRDVVVDGELDGKPVSYRGGDVEARPAWQRKFQVFRAVDAEGPTSCQPSIGPAV